MKIANIATVSTYSPAFKAHTERTLWIVRPYRLTYKGAERILRREGRLGDGTVVRLETTLCA
jgi:hypothetical protein